MSHTGKIVEGRKDVFGPEIAPGFPSLLESYVTLSVDGGGVVRAHLKDLQLGAAYRVDITDRLVGLPVKFDVVGDRAVNVVRN